MKWICGTVAPWALAAGLLVSFTADAGIDLKAGVSAASQSPLSFLAESAALVPPSSGLIRAGLAAPRIRMNGLVREARLAFDLPVEAEELAAGQPLHGDLKLTPPDFPAVDRTRKGDPLTKVRSSLSRRAVDLGPRTGPVGLVLRLDREVLPPTILMTGPVQPPDLEGYNALEPVRPDDLTVTLRASSIQSPAAAAAGSTGAASGGTTPSRGGTTPTVGRAVALSSTTPAPADAVPVEIAAAPVSLPSGPDSGSGTTTATRGDNRPNYAELVDPDHLAREQRCLAEAVYFEARGEPPDGQAAVAQVVLNRVKSGLYPSTICGVVYQNRNRHLACQFTFACEGRSLRITDSEAWDKARRTAESVLEGKTYLADVGGATHYHANYVKPYWARRLKRMDVIGRHIFYQLRPGQT